MVALLLLPPPSTSQALSSSPPILHLPEIFRPTPDPNAHVKRYAGRTLDRIIGVVWWLLTVIGMGSAVVGIFNFLLGIGAWRWWALRTNVGALDAV